MATPRPFNAPTTFKPQISPMGEINRQVARMQALNPQPATSGWNPLSWFKGKGFSAIKEIPSAIKQVPSAIKAAPGVIKNAALSTAGPAAASSTGLYIAGKLAQSAGTPGAARMSKFGLGPTGTGSDAPVYQTPFNDVSSSGNITNIGGKSYDLSDPAQKAAYDKVIAADRASRPGQTSADIRGGGGLKPDGSGRFAPAPDGNGGTGTRTGPSPMTMEDANKILNRGGLEGKGYTVQNPFGSTQLPATSAALYQNDGSEISYNKELPEDMFVQESDLRLSRNAFDAGSGVEYGENLVQMPASGKIEYEQKAGAPLTVSSGNLKVSSANESAQQPEVNVDMARRRAFLDGDLNSMEALRAIEGQKGIVVTGNTYNVVNPDAGKEGENDFIKIDKAQRDTIMRGGEGARNLLNSYVTDITQKNNTRTDYSYNSPDVEDPDESIRGTMDDLPKDWRNS